MELQRKVLIPLTHSHLFIWLLLFSPQLSFNNFVKQQHNKIGIFGYFPSYNKPVSEELSRSVILSLLQLRGVINKEITSIYLVSENVTTTPTFLPLCFSHTLYLKVPFLWATSLQNKSTQYPKCLERNITVEQCKTLKTPEEQSSSNSFHNSPKTQQAKSLLLLQV